MCNEVETFHTNYLIRLQHIMAYFHYIYKKCDDQKGQ